MRDATLDVLRRHGMTTIFGNPGSTEIPFLTDLPDDLRFVLGLHEGSVVGMASGYALARGEPSLVNLHTVAGLGNAVNAIANARDSRIPLVIVVGQQDRRQLVLEPFLTGRALERLAGEYPVWSATCRAARRTCPARSRARTTRPRRAARRDRGRPMGDWLEPADEAAAGAPARPAARSGRRRPGRPSWPSCSTGADRRRSSSARAPTAPRAGTPSSHWPSASAARCGRSRSAARAGFPQDHPLFAGHLPWQRRLMRETLSGTTRGRAVGTAAFRLYLFDEPGPLVEPGTRVAVLTDDPAEAHRSSCELARRGAGRGACRALTERLPERPAPPATVPRAGAVAAPAARASRCAPVTCSTRSPSASRPTRCWSRSRPRAGPSSYAANPRARPARVPESAQRRPRLRPVRRDRAAHGPARPPGGRRDRRRLHAVLDPSAVERGPLRRRRAADRDRQRRATRSWTGSRAATAASPPGRGSRRSTSAAWPARSAARRCGWTRTTTSTRVLDDVLPGLAARSEPLVLECVVGE